MTDEQSTTRRAAAERFLAAVAEIHPGNYDAIAARAHDAPDYPRVSARVAALAAGVESAEAFENAIATNLADAREASGRSDDDGLAIEAVALTTALAVLLRPELSADEFAACYAPFTDVIPLGTIELAPLDPE